MDIAKGGRPTKSLSQDEVSELALKHTDTDSTRAAYARSQLFDERKKVLAAYSKYAITGQSLANANVIPIKRGAS